MGRSQLAVLSMLILLTSVYSIPSNHFRLPLAVYPLSQVLQIDERFINGGHTGSAWNLLLLNS
jgi:hypothetical protein